MPRKDNGRKAADRRRAVFAAAEVRLRAKAYAKIGEELEALADAMDQDKRNEVLADGATQAARGIELGFKFVDNVADALRRASREDMEKSILEQVETGNGKPRK